MDELQKLTSPQRKRFVHLRQTAKPEYSNVRLAQLCEGTGYPTTPEEAKAIRPALHEFWDNREASVAEAEEAAAPTDYWQCPKCLDTAVLVTNPIICASCKHELTPEEISTLKGTEYKAMLKQAAKNLGLGDVPIDADKRITALAELARIATALSLSWVDAQLIMGPWPYDPQWLDQAFCKLGDITIPISKEDMNRLLHECASKRGKPEPIEPGTKHDQGKTCFSLLPTAALAQIADVLAFGAEKYERDNWQHVDPPSRYIDAALRHIYAHCEGEREDFESGLTHLAHAGACIMFLLWFMAEGREV